MKKVFFAILSCVLLFSFGSIVNADGTGNLTEEFYTGLDEMTEEELEAFHSTLPRIIDVKPNSIALSRLSEDESILLENIEVAEIGEEMVYAMPGEEISLMSTSTEFQLADAVDVSKSLTFPPIGNQGETGSCLPWALCYYQFTNNTCLVRGLQARTESGQAVSENIIAPGFIYSLVNGGTDSGSNFAEVCYALANSGCPNMNKYALEITEESLKRWSTDADVWYDAMYNKPKNISHIPIPTDNIVNGETDEIVQVKEILSNGYVVTFSTYIESWVFTNETTTGEYACRYIENDMQGAHAMTIVGYNDNFWVDINDNGSPEEGEFGAFKVVNSWGYDSSLFPQGFAWIAYDAFGLESGVTDTPTDRISVMKEAFYVLIPWKNYTPLLVAEVEITTANREYIRATFDVVCTKDNEQGYLLPVLLNEVASTVFYSWKDEMDTNTNVVNFSGTTGEETITVPFDLTSIMGFDIGTVIPKTSLRVYVSIEDGNSEDGLSVSFGNVKIIEPMTGRTAEYSGGEQFISGLSNPVKYLDFETTPFVGYSKWQDITVEFNGNVQAESVKENIYLITTDGEIVYPECEVSGNKIIISAPKEGYDFNTKYELNITDDVMSKGGNYLKNNNEILIYIVTETTVIDVPV